MGRRTLAWIADLLLYVGVVAAGFASMGEYVDVPVDIVDPCQQLEDQASANGEDFGACLDFRDMGIEEAENRVYLLDASEAGPQTAISLGWLAFFVVLQGLTGGSPGKLLFGLRVVDQYGARCGVGKSLGRTLLWVVDAAPWLVPIVGPIAAFTSTGHRRVGDLAAGTYVVTSSAVGSPVMPGTAAPPPGQAPWGAPPPDWSAAPTGPPVSPPPSDGSFAAPPATPAAPPTDGWTPTAGKWSPSPGGGPDLEPAPTDPASPAPAPPPFVAPGADVSAASAAAPPASPRHELPPPQWDPARGTYLQWEPNRQAWLQWDAVGQGWKPIDT